MPKWQDDFYDVDCLPVSGRSSASPAPPLCHQLIIPVGCPGREAGHGEVGEIG